MTKSLREMRVEEVLFEQSEFCTAVKTQRRGPPLQVADVLSLGKLYILRNDRQFNFFYDSFNGDICRSCASTREEVPHTIVCVLVSSWLTEVYPI